MSTGSDLIWLNIPTNVTLIFDEILMFTRVRYKVRSKRVT